MDRKTSIVVRNFAERQIEVLQLLVDSINTNENLHGQLAQSDILIKQYSEDLDAAQARIGEDQATIQFKDNQLLAAESELKAQKLDMDALSSENERQKMTLSTYEKSIESLQSELKGYRDMAPVIDSRP